MKKLIPNTIFILMNFLFLNSMNFSFATPDWGTPLMSSLRRGLNQSINPYPDAIKFNSFYAGLAGHLNPRELDALNLQNTQNAVNIFPLFLVPEDELQISYPCVTNGHRLGIQADDNPQDIAQNICESLGYQSALSFVLEDDLNARKNHVLTDDMSPARRRVFRINAAIGNHCHWNYARWDKDLMEFSPIPDQESIFSSFPQGQYLESIICN